MFSDSDFKAAAPHLAELRLRLILSFLVMAVVMVVLLTFYQQTWRFLLIPLKAASVSPSGVQITLRGLGPLDGFMAVARASVLLGLAVSLPFIIFQAWGFVRPGLKAAEKKALSIIGVCAPILFLAGAALSFIYVAPFMIRVLVAFNANLEMFRDEWTADRYLGFLTMSTCGLGLCFELPLVMSVLARLGLITPQKVIHYWRHSILAIFFLAAVLTPPDPASQIVFGLILTALYFTSYLLVRIFYRGE